MNVLSIILLIKGFKTHNISTVCEYKLEMKVTSGRRKKGMGKRVNV